MLRTSLLVVAILFLGAMVWLREVAKDTSDAKEEQIEAEYQRGLRLKDELVGERMADSGPALRSVAPKRDTTQAAPLPATLAESEHALTRDTPRALLMGVVAAIERGDRAWLARVVAANRHASTLTVALGETAATNFLVPDVKPRWSALQRGIASGTLVIEEQDDAALASVLPADGDAGMSVELSRINGQWYVAE